MKFSLSDAKVAKAFEAVTSAQVQPELHIAFTIDDTKGASTELLQAAAENAYEKARILTEATGVRLGQLLSVDYDWVDVNFLSPTRFESDVALTSKQTPRFSFNPEEINLTDSATFVYQLVD